jgi:hypothetical protein
MFKYSFLTASVLVLAACGSETTSDTPPASGDQTPAAPAVELQTPEPAYDESWHKTSFWAGEYPNGIAIIDKQIVLKAHLQAHPDAPATLECPVDYLGNYHPWNQTRIAANNLEFMTMTKITKIPVVADFSIVDGSLDSANPVVYSFKTGDSIDYLGYLAEGYGLFRLDGKDVDLHLGEFADGTNWPEDEGQVDEWLAMSCAGQTGYIYAKDIAGLNGVKFGPDGIMGYGEAADLSEEQATNLRKEAK